MTEAKLREEIVAAVAFLEEVGLNHGSSGNISVRLGDHILITPSGARASNLTPDLLVRLDLNGELAAGSEGVPSTEWRLHTELMRHNPEVQAVVHSHADSCVALSCQRKPIPPFHYMVASFGGNTIPCARYEALGSDALAAAVVKASHGHKACLMANHGMITQAASLTQALDLAVKLEMLARQYILALQAGAPVLLTEAEMAEVHRRYPYYGHARMPR